MPLILFPRDRCPSSGRERFEDFQMPRNDEPAYVEFRIGDSEEEFAIIDRRYAPKGIQTGPGGAFFSGTSMTSRRVRAPAGASGETEVPQCLLLVLM